MSSLSYRQFTQQGLNNCKVRRGSWFLGKRSCSWLRLSLIQSFDNDLIIAFHFLGWQLGWKPTLCTKFAALKQCCIPARMNHRCKLTLCCFVSNAFVVTQESGFQNSACLMLCIEAISTSLSYHSYCYQPCLLWSAHHRVPLQMLGLVYEGL